MVVCRLLASCLQAAVPGPLPPADARPAEAGGRRAREELASIKTAAETPCAREHPLRGGEPGDGKWRGQKKRSWGNGARLQERLEGVAHPASARASKRAAQLRATRDTALRKPSPTEPTAVGGRNARQRGRTKNIASRQAAEHLKP